MGGEVLSGRVGLKALQLDLPSPKGVQGPGTPPPAPRSTLTTSQLEKSRLELPGLTRWRAAHGPRLLGQAPQAQRTRWRGLDAARKAFGLKLSCKLCQLKTSGAGWGSGLELAAGFLAVWVPLSARAWPGPACGTRNRGSSEATCGSTDLAPVASIACNEEACTCRKKKSRPRVVISELIPACCGCCRARQAALAVHNSRSVRFSKSRHKLQFTR